MQLKSIIKETNKVLGDRSSVKKYDTSVKISREEISDILQDAMTAPSSFNLQPWRFVVVDSEEGKNKVKPFMMFNQTQWETASAIIAVYADLQSASNADRIYSSSVEHNLLTADVKDKIVGMIGTYTSQYSESRLRESLFLDCGLVSMQIMLSARAHGYDTNAIGGYDRKEFTDAMGLDASRYVPVMLISIGKEDVAGHESVRFSVDEVTQWK